MRLLLLRDDRLTAKQAVFPGITNWIWPDTAFSLTPDSIQGWFNSLHAWQKSRKLNKLCNIYVLTAEDSLSPCWLRSTNAQWEYKPYSFKMTKHAICNTKFQLSENRKDSHCSILFLLYLLPFLLQSYPHNLTPSQLLFHLFHHG